MPLFEFVCENFRREQELLIRGEEQPTCQECGSVQLTKLLSVPAAHSDMGVGSKSTTLPPGACGTGCGCFPQ